MTPADARTLYVLPAMQKINHYSLNAERLLMGTAAIESNFVNFIQFGGGPARGMFQMEAATFNDIVKRYLALPGHKKLRDVVTTLAQGSQPTFLELQTNHLLAAALARIKFMMIPKGIPATLKEQAAYWWTHYNGESPHGLKPEDYLSRWQTYCAPLYPDFK